VFGIGEIFRTTKNRNASHLKDVERKTSLIVDESKTLGSEARNFIEHQIPGFLTGNRDITYLWQSNCSAVNFDDSEKFSAFYLLHIRR
jgi:hypothetical protein